MSLITAAARGFVIFLLSAQGIYIFITRWLKQFRNPAESGVLVINKIRYVMSCRVAWSLPEA